MILARSLRRKLAVMAFAILAFVLLYEVTMFDSRENAPRNLVDPTLPAAGARLVFTATAYCKGTTTASGVGVRTGIAASDPLLLPVGSVINVSTDDTRYNGVYTIMDTGPQVQGRIIDLFMSNCAEAQAFGRRSIEITVLRLGWSPTASTPSLIDRLFRRRERVLPAPLPPPPGAETSSPEVDDESEADTAPAPVDDPAAAQPPGS